MREVRVVAFLFLIASGCAAPAAEEKLTRWDSSARLLAGMDLPESDPLYSLTRTDEWQTHHRAMDRRFSEFEDMYGKKITPWAASEIGDSGAGVVFYPFGGPDLLFPLRLFPDAKEYILFGMESPGKQPDPASVYARDRIALASVFPTIRKSLAWFLNFTYFQTYQMDKWLRGRDLGGAGPVMMVFLARSGATITDVQEFQDPSAHGIRISFKRAGKDHTATYYTVNASDSSLSSNPGFLAGIRSRGERVSYMKAASYLLYGPGFDIVRNFVTTESQMIVSDEAGVPLSSYPPEMELRFYGNYDGPLPMYWPMRQKALDQAYARESRSLPFDLGYTASWKRNASVLIVASRKHATPGERKN
ncbi:MAG TPA: hypothetical protein PKE49_04600 [Leptospiraceae bacterium]|nr:hypothetical protein [Leptospirales bacterium]HMU83898.1 hypothetical protein [Leptospiraceae bacterium]HMW61624.1 hypothetical protein [Leptospiraceae bacterium]HMX55778.1 hypothetical protein [Leptospiraceae bacterium]HNE23151.1 hypothetical protein [Leptospiraceae bacterium]